MRRIIWVRLFLERASLNKSPLCHDNYINFLLIYSISQESTSTFLWLQLHNEDQLKLTHDLIIINIITTCDETYYLGKTLFRVSLGNFISPLHVMTVIRNLLLMYSINQEIT